MVSVEEPARSSARSTLVRLKLMAAAERLYAQRGLTNVSDRQIGETAGQRNKSAVAYHFTNRDELIMAILAHHAESTDRFRNAMLDALDPDEPITLSARAALHVLPEIEHQIELGTPAWYAQFRAQVLTEPVLRVRSTELHENTSSRRRLAGLGLPDLFDDNSEIRIWHAAIARQLVVHMTAELEEQLGSGRASAKSAERSWRQLGKYLVKAITAVSASFAAEENQAD
jgi:AcrR family transcriptional regulator